MTNKCNADRFFIASFDSFVSIVSMVFRVFLVAGVNTLFAMLPQMSRSMGQRFALLQPESLQQGSLNCGGCFPGSWVLGSLGILRVS